MDEELQLSYLVKNNAEPFGKPKVYFSYHPNDIDTLKHISKLIFAKQDCAIYYYDYSNGEPDQEELESLLREMLMFVVPVSADYLTKPCTAYDFEYRIANTYSIPVLPLLQSRDIGRLCNQKMHNRQYLNELDDDPTAISFDTKLGLFLSNIITPDSLTEKIEDAFYAQVFLSYRKKNRDYARKLMNALHKDERCKAVSIWYDEYLVPGKSFESGIKKNLESSDAVILLVTPQLLEPNNYVKEKEYPQAKKIGKTILPVEAKDLADSEREVLYLEFKDLSECLNLRDEKGIVDELINKIGAWRLKKVETTEHQYLLGLAYQRGIGVETDRASAYKLFKNAATNGHLPAIDEMYQIYFNGNDYDGDTFEILDLYNTYLQKRITDYYETKDIELLPDIMQEWDRLANIYSRASEIETDGEKKAKYKKKQENSYFDKIWFIQYLSKDDEACLRYLRDAYASLFIFYEKENEIDKIDAILKETFPQFDKKRVQKEGGDSEKTVYFLDFGKELNHEFQNDGEVIIEDMPYLSAILAAGPGGPLYPTMLDYWSRAYHIELNEERAYLYTSICANYACLYSIDMGKLYIWTDQEIYVSGGFFAGWLWYCRNLSSQKSPAADGYYYENFTYKILGHKNNREIVSYGNCSRKPDKKEWLNVAISIIKRGDSSDPGATVLGAKYGLFKASNDTLIEEIALNDWDQETETASGSFQLKIKKAGEYYIKETEATNYFDIDTERYGFTVDFENQCLISNHNDFVISKRNKHVASIVVIAKPTTMSFEIMLVKKAENQSASAPSLADAVFGLYDARGNELARRKTVQAAGQTYAELEDSFVVISNKADYYIQEISAPTGYKKDTTMYWFSADPQGGTDHEGIITPLDDETKDSFRRLYNRTLEVTVIEENDTPEYGAFIFKKVDKNNDPLPGAEFELYKRADVKRINGEYDFTGATPVNTYTANANGNVIGTRIPFNTYVIHESKVPMGKVACADMLIEIVKGKWTYPSPETKGIIVDDDVSS